jgi:hypothetical protein
MPLFFNAAEYGVGRGQKSLKQLTKKIETAISKRLRSIVLRINVSTKMKHNFVSV